MLKLKKTTSELLSEAVKTKFGEGLLSADDIFAMLEYPPDKSMGDLALPCFRLSKTLRRSPVQIAEALASELNSELYSSVSAVNGYLNIKMNAGAFAARVIADINAAGDKYGSPMCGEGKTVVLDYSSPNVAKPFHIGHLGTTVIGHSLKLLHEFAGYKCIGINYLGDWGTQFGKLIVAYKLWGDKERVESLGVDELVSLYVKINNAIKDEENESIKGLSEAEAQAKKHSELADASRREFAKLESGDEENLALWRWFVDVSLKAYKKTYELLGIEFDSYKGESFYTDKMPAQVEKLRNMGLLEIDDGASIVNLDKWNMPVCLILKRDGSTLYPTRDIAAAVYRHGEYNFDKAIYVTSAGQSLHFAQWFKVVELMGYDWYDKLVHIPYGTISVAGVKLSTRHGNVLLLRDVFGQAVDKVRSVINEKNPELENKESVAEAVGIGAIIYYYLLGSTNKSSSFVMDDALSFDGNTGPYAQYTYARTCSILAKAKESGFAPSNGSNVIITSDEEFELSKMLALFPEKVKSALDMYEPSVITHYIFDVATAFNRFYHNCQVLGADDDKVRATRLALTESTGHVLKSAFSLICMKAPEKV